MNQDEQILDAQLLLTEYELLYKKHRVLELILLGKRMRFRQSVLPLLQQLNTSNDQLIAKVSASLSFWAVVNHFDRLEVSERNRK
jgi:hypothetical protein